MRLIIVVCVLFALPLHSEPREISLSLSNASRVLDKQNSKPTQSMDVPLTIRKELNEGFEGGFPGQWVLSGNPTWGTETFRKFSGLRSAYGVGSNVNPLGPYPPNTNSWMVYGPFDLSNVESAVLTFKFWIDTEIYYDFLNVYASINNSDFYGIGWSGYGGYWRHANFNLSNVYKIGNLLGKQRVWIAFHFESDSIIQYEGVYVDNVILTVTRQNAVSDENSHLPAIYQILLFDDYE